MRQMIVFRGEVKPLKLSHKVIFAAIACAMVAVAQNPITADSPFQVKYASNVTGTSDAVINISNSGANGASLQGPGVGSAGNICVNVYAFSPDEQEVSCCSCLVTPNALVSLSVFTDLTSNTLTGVRPRDVTVKPVATLAGAGGTGTSCNNSAATATAGNLATGLLAWGTVTHPAGPINAVPTTTETAFTPATLSAGELASITNRCLNIIGNGSGFGICRSCRFGGLGGSKL